MDSLKDIFCVIAIWEWKQSRHYFNEQPQTYNLQPSYIESTAAAAAASLDIPYNTTDLSLPCSNSSSSRRPVYDQIWHDLHH